MIDAVLFDLDDTLCAYRVHGSEVLASAFDAVGVEPLFSIEDYYRVYDEFADAGDTVEAQRADCFAALAADAGADPEVGRAVAEAYAEARDHRDVAFTDGAERALERLSARYRIGLVTNGAPGMQAVKLETLGLADAFETVVHGGHDAPAKPSPEPFYRACADLSVEPERAVHVGNSLEADVAGARAAGLRAVWLPESPGAEPDGHDPDYVIGSLAELADPPWSGEG